MKLLIVLCLLALTVAQEQYTSENDHIDIEAVVNNDKTLKAYYGCFMDISPCDEVQGAFKVDLPEAIQQSCAKCTPAQRRILKRFLGGLKEKFPQDYNDFKKKFDPEDKNISNLEATN